MDVLEKSDKVAVAISRHYVRATRNAFCFPANIRNDLVVLKMRETNIQHTEWNGLIQRIFEAGLVAKWSHTARKSNELMNSDEGLITINHYVGMLVFVSICWILAILIAILERAIHHKVKQENHHRYWSVADMVIDGRRHMFIFNRYRVVPT